MTDPIRLSDVRARRRPTTFSKAELSLLMGAYSRRVSSGEWRDYAIDFRPGMAIFSIFRHAAEQPLFAVIKLTEGAAREVDWLLYSGPRRVAQGGSVSDVLDVFDRRPHLLRL
jgi:hypothetical protein